VTGMTVGFVGVGRMGQRMARHIIGAGFPVHVFDVSADAMAQLVAAGAQPARSAAEIAARCEVVLTVLPTAAAVEQAVAGAEGIVSGIHPGTVVVEMSTIPPAVARRLASVIEARGADYLDCPISGGVLGAEQGSLTLMVGGKPEVLERCRDVLAPMAGAIYHMGEIGAGLTTKLINQLLTMTQTVLVMEALAMGARAGIDLSTLHDLISKSSGTSWCWENRIPRILREAADTWVTLDICHKDLGLAKTLGEELGVPLFVSTGAFQVLQMAKGMDLGARDVSALGRLYEQMLGVTLRSEVER
jgi:3-hydroxyisobutyrate dehydrogenase-like beta-hydroxyacid dehydrogenase